MTDTSVTVRLPNHDVTIDVDPADFLKLIPGFLIQAEMKRRADILAEDPTGAALEPTAQATVKDFPPGATIAVDGEADINTTTEVDLSESDFVPQHDLDCSADDVDTLAEAFREHNIELFELRFSQMAPSGLADRMSIQLRR